MTARLVLIWVRLAISIECPSSKLIQLGTTYSCVANYEGSGVEISMYLPTYLYPSILKIEADNFYSRQ